MPKRPQPDPPDPKNITKTLHCQFFDFCDFCKYRSQDARKSSTQHPKWRPDGHFETNLDRLGAILDPSWRPKTSQAAPRSRQDAPTSRQDQAKTPQDITTAPQGRQKQDLGWVWEGFCYDFLQFFLTFILCIVLGTSLPKVAYLSRSFRSMPSQVSHALATKTEPRRAQDGSKMRILAHLRHLCANMLPRSSQLEAQIAQDGRTCSENR